MWKWIKRLFKKKDPVIVVVPPVQPIPEIPTPEEVENFPRRQIADFKFVDSSHHHEDFDPKKYTAKFLSNKCTQGTNFIDKTHAPRKRACLDNGIEYSGYHFYECRRDPIEQAQFYVKNHGEFTSAPCIDFEEYSQAGQDEKTLSLNMDNLYVCLLEVKRLTGKIPWLYINYGVAGRLKFSKKFAEFPIWFARYNSYLGPIPSPWTEETTAAWQFTESGSFDGFNGTNDVNIYYGKVNALNLK